MVLLIKYANVSRRYAVGFVHKGILSQTQNSL